MCVSVRICYLKPQTSNQSCNSHSIIETYINIQVHGLGVPHFSLTLAFKQLILILSVVPVLRELSAGSCHANPKSWGPTAGSQAAISIFLIAPDCPPKTFQ